MKNLKMITTLMFLFMLTILTAQNTTKKAVKGLNQGYWTLGLNGGIAYQTADVKSNGGYGLGMTLAKNLYYQPGALLTFDLRGRLKYAQTKGLDTQRSYDIENNSALNGTNTLLDYTSYPISTNIDKGFVYQNYKNHLGELGLEGVVSFNKLAEDRNILLSLYGGIGLDYYNTYIDQYNSVQNTDYKTDYAGLNPNQNVTSIKNALESSILDGDYETQADGFKQSYGALGFMPNLGIELGYQVTPRVAVGVGHKFTFSRTDNLDGHQWKNAGNDLHHYTNAFLKIKIKDGQSKMDLPKVIITNPPYTRFETDKEVFNVLATIKNVSNAFDIDCKVNGRDVNFDYYDEIFNTDIRLRPGENKIRITGHNPRGSAHDEVIIIFKPYENPNKPPICTWVNPKNNGQKVNKADFIAKAKINNTTQRKDIRLKVNGQIVYDFRLKDKMVELSTNLNLGQNTLDIEVSNAYGTDRDVITVIYEKPVKRPVVDIKMPSNQTRTKSNAIAIKAETRNVTHRGDVEVTLNGQNVYDFRFANGEIEFNAPLNLGENYVEITVHNDDGNASDHVTIIREREAVYEKPTVRITRFEVNKSNTNDCNATLRAQVENVHNKNEITIYLNGRAFYDFVWGKNTQTIEATMAINSGDNIMNIKVGNQGGRDSDQAELRCTINEPVKPIVTFIYPDAYTTTHTVVQKDIRVSVRNVAHKNEISLRVNNKTQAFSYNSQSELLTARITLREGNNVVRVTASNNNGQAEAERQMRYIKEIMPIKPPKVSIVKPSNNQHTVTPTTAIIAIIKYVKNKNNLRIKVNNNLVNNFIYNALSGKLSFTAPLVSGRNTIWVEGTNNDGRAEDQVQIFYDKVNPPTVNITKPDNRYRSKKAPISVMAKLKYVTRKNDISVRLNGNSISFNYNTLSGTVTANVRLKEGQNSLVVSGQNSSSNAEDNIIIFYDKTPQPTVKISKPLKNSTSTRPKTIVKASLKNVFSKTDITFKVNGQAVSQFSYKNGSFEAMANLKEGKNILQVVGKNDTGTAEDSVNILYHKRKVLPTIEIQYPQKPGTQVDMPKYDLVAKIQNINTKNDIQVFLNGEVVQKFTFTPKGGQLIARLMLKAGNNTIKVIANNTDGKADAETTIILKPSLVLPVGKKPTVIIQSISIPVQNPFDPTLLKSTVLAELTQIDRADQIELRINNEIVNSFTFDAVLGMMSYTFELKPGVNTVYIKVTNTSGSDEDEGSVSGK